MTEREALKLALDKKAENARELGLDYEPENTLHWHALNYRTAPTQNAQKMFAALEKFVEDAIKDALAQQCVCGEPNSLGTHRTDGPCLAPQPEQEPATKEQIREAMVFNLPLYTTPPQRTWVGLTDDEIFKVAAFGNEGGWFGDFQWQHDTVGFVRAIEAKLKEKNT